MTSAANLSRKDRERQQHRQEILSVARQLFAEKGFYNVSMHQIAAAAEFATGTLYNFFPSKEDLFFDLLVASAQDALGLVLPVLDGPGDERQRLSKFIRLHERVAREQSAAIQLYLLENRWRYVPGARVEAKKKELHEDLIRRLSRVIAAGVRKGLFNRIDPLVAARCLSATLESVVIAFVEGPQASNLKRDLQKVEAVFFNGFLKSSRDRRDA